MTDTHAPAIVAEDLCKRYPEVTAVDSLNLEIRRGEIYGFLGRNGAGKSAFIIMSAMRKRSSNTCPLLSSPSEVRMWLLAPSATSR